MKAPRPLPKHSAPWISPGQPIAGGPTPDFYKYMRDQDEVIRLLLRKIETLEIRVHDLENP